MAKTSHFFSGFAATRARLALLAGACVVATVGFVAPARAADVTFDLDAVTGKATAATLPGLTVSSVPILAYKLTSEPAAVTNPGGPKLEVNQGDRVTINLTNRLTVPTSLLLQGQGLVPDTTGVPVGQAKSYTFTASQPGTYLYEAGLIPNTQYQAAMGLHGALVVKPATAGQAYADATGTTAYDVESVLVLSELDPALNNFVRPTTGCLAAQFPDARQCFDMRTFAPKYFLINGKPYPGTDPIAAAAGNKVLLRYVNAGVKHHSMAVLGLRQNFVAKDGNLLPTLTRNVAAETLAPGQTADAIAIVPATATTDSRFAVYDASLMLHNNGAADFGGMLTFVTAGTGAGAGGPTTSGVTLSPAKTAGVANVTVTASIAGNGANVTAAEYFIDAVGANGTGTTMSGVSGTSANANASGTILANTLISNSLAAGNHTIYVRGSSGTGTSAIWGPVSSAVLNLDKAGPASNSLTLTPNPSNGTVAVTLSASANDSASGGSNVTVAEYTVDNGPAVPMALGGAPAPIRAASATIAAGTMAVLTPGAHTVSVRSQDELGNWGLPTTIPLNVVKTPPTTSLVSASPNPNNGTKPLSATQPVVRVTAKAASTGSTVAGAEGFIDTVGANGSGFPLVASDGVWNSASETGYADIPLTTIASLSNGNHTIHVHSRDATGNWGGTSTTTLVIDKVAPMVSSIVAVGTSPTNGTSVQFLVTFSKSVTGGVAGNFSLATSGVSGASIASVSGSGNIRTVTVNTGTGSGTIGLNMTSSTGLTDQAGNAVAPLPVIGQAFTIDKALPTVSVTPATSTVAFNTPATLTVTASDVGSSITLQQYWVDGSATPPANPTAFAGSSLSVVGLTGGTHTIYVRVQDAAGNWSTVASVTVYVVQAVNDVYNVTLSTDNNTNNPAFSRTQTFTVISGSGVLVNDQPTGVAGRTATPSNPTVNRTAGTGRATMAVSLSNNGGFSYTLTVPSTVTGNPNIRAAKRGTYQFTYTETLNGATSNATVTITVN